MSISNIKATALYKEAIQATAQEIEAIKEEVRLLKKKNQEPTRDITDLVAKLDNLHLGGTTFRTQDKGKIKVFRNPFDLLKQIK